MKLGELIYILQNLEIEHGYDAAVLANSEGDIYFHRYMGKPIFMKDIAFFDNEEGSGKPFINQMDAIVL